RAAFGQRFLSFFPLMAALSPRSEENTDVAAQLRGQRVSREENTMAMASTAGRTGRGMTREEKKVIFASSLGTVFEWYDFYLYGSLAAFIGATFFSPTIPEATRNIFALLAFAAGFLVRPFGALVFGRLGYYTSWIQTTATLGLFLSLIVILIVQGSLSKETYASWGWRIPFIVSFLLLVVSIWIRLSLSESPTFLRMKEEGKGSKAPL